MEPKSFIIFLLVQPAILGLYALYRKPATEMRRRLFIADALLNKTLINVPSLVDDPYHHSPISEDVIFAALNSSAVCGLHYVDDSRTSYYLETHRDFEDAIAKGGHVTHLGHCGLCSSLQDLAVYILHPNLADPVKWCGYRARFSKQLQCLSRLGFTRPCSAIWQYNLRNTRNECLWTCLQHLGDPYNSMDGSLNPCIQCDEDKSGPIFKYYAGRTRRGSGLISGIRRKEDEIANLLHLYY